MPASLGEGDATTHAKTGPMLKGMPPIRAKVDLSRQDRHMLQRDGQEHADAARLACLLLSDGSIHPRWNQQNRVWGVRYPMRVPLSVLCRRSRAALLGHKARMLKTPRVCRRPF